MEHPFIAGPCVIESQELLETVAKELVRLNKLFGIDIIFKASFDKANRTSIRSFRGPGMDKGLQMLADINRPRFAGMESNAAVKILQQCHARCGE